MGNEKKSKQLGIPFGTASNQLRKKILFQLVQETGRDTCYKCNNIIENVSELSIEHKETWLDSKNPVELFFDLNNIAFSHLSCNSVSGDRYKQGWGNYKKSGKKCPPGTGWCCKCKTFKPVDQFWKDRKRFCGLQCRCIPCQKEAMKK